MQIAAFHSRALEKCLRFSLTFEDLMILLAGINLKHKISFQDIRINLNVRERFLENKEKKLKKIVLSR